MSEMIERVARAIDPDIWELLDNPRTMWSYDAAGQSLGRARAAIEAMREPTPKMVLHMAALSDFSFGHHETVENYNREFDLIWRLGIDAALAPSPSVREDGK